MALLDVVRHVNFIIKNTHHIIWNKPDLWSTPVSDVPNDVLATSEHRIYISFQCNFLNIHLISVSWKGYEKKKSFKRFHGIAVHTIAEDIQDFVAGLTVAILNTVWVCVYQITTKLISSHTAFKLQYKNSIYKLNKTSYMYLNHKTTTFNILKKKMSITKTNACKSMYNVFQIN